MLHTCRIQIPLNDTQISIISQVLQVDHEKNIQKTITCSENILTVEIASTSLKLCRTIMNSIMEHVILMIETMEEFS